MAGETLLTLSEMLASFPDNTQGLIEPLDSRSMIVSEAINVGYLAEDGAGWTQPVTDGVYTSLNPNIVSPSFAGNLWKADGNNAFLPSYTDIGVTVNPGTVRLSAFRFAIRCTKTGGGSASYSFQFHIGGVPFGRDLMATVTTSDQYVVSTTDTLQDMSLADAVDIRVAGDGTGDDLDITEFSMRASGAPL